MPRLLFLQSLDLNLRFQQTGQQMSQSGLLSRGKLMPMKWRGLGIGRHFVPPLAIESFAPV
jgi:hypothetical protein